MKTIKVFLASSEDLTDERLEFSSLIEQVNKLFKKRNIEIELVKWQHSDGAPNSNSTKEEFTEKLKDCELCLTLYYNQFANTAKKEFETAYEELKNGNNPKKVYVFFKDSVESAQELQDFKDSFATAYGHFFGKFENVDTMRLQFLLQFELYQDGNERILSVQNQKVAIDGEELVNLNNIPFASMNKEFIRLRDGLEKTQKRIDRCRKRLLEDPEDEDSKEELNEYLAERNKMQEEIDKHQGFLFDLARKTSELATQRLSERSREAIRLFNEGDAAGANAVLNTEDLQRDTEQSFKDYDEHTARVQEAKDRIELQCNDWLLKVDTVLADEMNSFEERIKEAENAYEQAHLCVKKLQYNENNKLAYSRFLRRFIDFTYKYGKYEKTEDLWKEKILFEEKHLGIDFSNNILPCREKCFDLLYSNKTKGFAPDVTYSYRCFADFYRFKKDFDNALVFYEKILVITERTFNAQHPEVIKVYDKIALLYISKKDFDKALEIYTNSLAILQEKYGLDSPKIATSYDKFGNAYSRKGDYDKALEFYNKAFSIREKNFGLDNPEIATSYDNFGDTYSEKCDYDKALEFYQKALAINIDFSKNLVVTARSYRFIARTYENMKEYEKALEYYQKVYAIHKEESGEAHAKTRLSKKNIADLEKLIASQKG